MVTYRETLRSARWRRLKWRRTVVAGFKCERCGVEYVGRSRRAALRWLELHHVTYARVGSERLEDVRVLCRACHGIEHGIDPA